MDSTKKITVDRNLGCYVVTIDVPENNPWSGRSENYLKEWDNEFYIVRWSEDRKSIRLILPQDSEFMDAWNVLMTAPIIEHI